MAKTLKTKELKEQYEKYCNEYVKKFCHKQGFDFNNFYWVTKRVGGVLCIGCYYLYFLDILWDINSKQPKELILQWYNKVFDGEIEANYFDYTKIKTNEAKTIHAD